MTPPRPDCYEYVRRAYGVPAYIGMVVRVAGEDAVLVAARGHGDQYVHARMPNGRVWTLHPTDAITYCPVGCELVVPK